MTIEEHIENLKAIASDMPSDKCSDWIESLMAGVKALEQEPCEDAISMDKTIVQLSHLLSDWDDDWNVAIRKCIETVKNVPLVTPSYNSIKNELKPCGDCISRQATIDEVSRILDDHPLDGYEDGQLILKTIQDMPPVTPTKKAGQWEYVQYDGNPNIGNWHCSECRLIVDVPWKKRWSKKPEYNYCPNCGECMEVDDGK